MKGKFENEDVILREVTQEERLLNSLNASNPDLNNDDDDDMDDSIPFTKKMRAATRKIHNISDALVNAKLGIAMSDDRIWAEGLLIFYEIFRLLEQAMLRLSPRNQHFSRMAKVINGVERTTAFEMDLDYFYGKDRLKTYQIRASVADYLKHLQTLEEREPLRLLAYIYHLYMGLLSGGMLLKKKRELGRRFNASAFSIIQWIGLDNCFRCRNINSSSTAESSNPNEPQPGNAVLTFTDGRSIGDIKKDIAFTMNDIASDLSKDEKDSLISESLVVFQRNNELVGSIQKTGITALKNISAHPIFILLMLFAIGSIWYFYTIS